MRGTPRAQPAELVIDVCGLALGVGLWVITESLVIVASKIWEDSRAR